MHALMRHVLSYLPHPLADDGERAAVLDATACLPAFSGGAFECRLAPGPSRPDVHAILERRPFPLPDGSSRTWRSIHAFCEEWCRGASAWRDTVHNLVLEFDVDFRDAQLSIPSCFVCFDSRRALPREHLFDAIDRVTCEHRLPAATRALVGLAMDALPPGAAVTQVGCMLSRTDAPVRMNVEGLDPDRATRFLSAIGWAGDPAPWTGLWRQLLPQTDAIALAVDLGATPGARVGLECFLSRSPCDEPRWPVLLDWLVDRGLCARSKAQALLQWPGASRPAVSQGWPAGLQLGDRFLGDRAISLIVRRINHIKISAAGDGTLAAKAYLFLGHQWFDRDRLISLLPSGVRPSAAPRP